MCTKDEIAKIIEYRPEKIEYIKNIFTEIKKDEYGEKYEIKESRYIDYFSIDDKDTNIVRINFTEFIKPLVS